jgi:hypothetical protein
VFGLPLIQFFAFEEMHTFPRNFWPKACSVAGCERDGASGTIAAGLQRPRSLDEQGEDFQLEQWRAIWRGDACEDDPQGEEG